MTRRSYPDFVMATRFFHSADIAELQDALCSDDREAERPRPAARAMTRSVSDAAGPRLPSPDEPVPLRGSAGHV